METKTIAPRRVDFTFKSLQTPEYAREQKIYNAQLARAERARLMETKKRVAREAREYYEKCMTEKHGAAPSAQTSNG